MNENINHNSNETKNIDCQIINTNCERKVTNDLLSRLRIIIFKEFKHHTLLLQQNYTSSGFNKTDLKCIRTSMKNKLSKSNYNYSRGT